jgi:hypothetical protein
VNPLLLRAQIAREMLDYPPRREWITDRNPPESGHYLVRVTNNEHTWVRLERWDGTTWATLGGYATPTGWMALPAV